jgi:branched-chain amino acid transport system permease protein
MTGSPLQGKTISRQIIFLLILTALVVIFPKVVSDQFLLHVIVVANLLALLAVSWDFVAGFMGQINFGQAMFYGAGAYFIGFLTKAYQIPAILGLLGGGLVAVLLSLIVGIPCLRLRGPYYSIATLAFCQVLFTLSMALPGLTGSEEGIRGIPKFLTTVEAHYYFSSFLLLAFLFVLRVLFRTPFGIRLISIREDERLSEAAGTDTARYKILGTSISAFVGGVAGAYSCYFHSHVSPDTLSIGLTFSAVAASVFGGMGTLWGAFVGAYVLTFLNEYLYFMMEYRLLIYPLAIMLILLFSPGGLLGLFSELGRIFQHGNAASARPDKEL